MPLRSTQIPTVRLTIDIRIRVSVQMSDPLERWILTLTRSKSNNLALSIHPYSCWLPELNHLSRSFLLVVDGCISSLLLPLALSTELPFRTNIFKWRPVVMSGLCSETSLQNNACIRPYQCRDGPIQSSQHRRRRPDPANRRQGYIGQAGNLGPLLGEVQTINSGDSGV